MENSQDMTNDETTQHEVMTVNDVVNKSNTSGLANNGSTCYINTALQCLGFCSHFLKYILAGQPKKNNTPLADDLREIYVQLWVHRNAIAPYKFLRSLQVALSDIINVFEQNDITEFLMLYVDKLNTDLSVEMMVDHEDFLELKKKIYAEHKGNKALQKLVYDMDVAWLNTIKKEYSPIMDLFYGQLISQIICGNCQHIHHNYEVYSSLPLPLTDTKESQTHHEVLQAYFSREYINTECKEWTCDNCKQSAKSPKCLKLYRNPMVLIVTLKRFDARLQKSGATVSMPLELDVSKYCLRDDNCHYKLSAVAHHQGGTGSGHYNCICHHKNGKWMAIDDMLVREASKDEIEYVLNHGYVYFYERQ